MALRLHNSLTRQKEDFVPLEPPKVGLYTCGPTVYNYAHIGNLRTFMFEDILRRYLEFKGFEVFHVMNLTDVEDKIIRTCRETGESREALVGRFTQAFYEDLDTLGIKRAHAYPAATEHIGDMVQMVQTLVEKGYAYESKGSYYFRLSAFPQYGALSHFDMEELRQNASGRVVDSDEYETDDVRDFALWKAWDEDDGDIFWETPLGKGRPGWHIECSCMSMALLGPSFDIHCGGIDNLFPHHENEIAQSEACSGVHPFVKYWLHSAHLFVENKKMSKSLGNFYTLRDLLEQGHDPLAIRYVLMSTHYRQPSNFTFDALEAAKEALRRIADFRERLGSVQQTQGSDLAAEIDTCRESFTESLDDDLNISGGLAAVFEFVRTVNARLNDGQVSQTGAQAALALLDKLNAVTGVFAPQLDEEIPPDVLARVEERQQARKAKDFARADALRDELLAEGWILKDTPEGAKVQKA
jgi:cysteinyl-tRNA synthetase